MLQLILLKAKQHHPNLISTTMAKTALIPTARCMDLDRRTNTSLDTLNKIHTVNLQGKTNRVYLKLLLNNWETV